MGQFYIGVTVGQSDGVVVVKQGDSVLTVAQWTPI